MPYGELGSLHLHCTAIADDETMGTAWVVTENLLSERFDGTLGVWTLFLGKWTVVFDMCGEELSLACELTACWSIMTVDEELVYHLGEDERRTRGD
jgi:hypothetical protein